MNGKTWIQLERHDLITAPFWHTWDYIMYLFTNRNQGPKGTSKHTLEVNPIIIGYIDLLL
jgi:hypothetical protein